MATTSNICVMHDQEQRGRPWTRWQGHQVQRKRRRAVTEATGSGRPAQHGRPTPPRPWTTRHLRTTGALATEPNLWKSEEDRTTGDRTTGQLRTSEPPRASRRPASHGRPEPGCVQLRVEAH